jgi:type II secretory pathway pseudopilin PulG
MPARLFLSRRGSSLLEIVVAGGILAFLVLALSPSLLNTRRAAALSANVSAATVLAVDKLEELRSVSSDDPALAAGTHQDPSNPLTPDGRPGGMFVRRWIVTDDVPDPGMKKVEMQVSWRDRTGQNAVNLVTLLLP